MNTRIICHIITLPLNREHVDQNHTCFSFAIFILLCRSTADWLVLSCLDDFGFFLVFMAAVPSFVLPATSIVLSSSRPLLVTCEGNPLCVSSIAVPLLDDFVFTFRVLKHYINKQNENFKPLQAIRWCIRCVESVADWPTTEVFNHFLQPQSKEFIIIYYHNNNNNNITRNKSNDYFESVQYRQDVRRKSENSRFELWYSVLAPSGGL